MSPECPQFARRRRSQANTHQTNYATTRKAFEMTEENNTKLSIDLTRADFADVSAFVQTKAMELHYIADSLLAVSGLARKFPCEGDSEKILACIAGYADAAANNADKFADELMNRKNK